MTTESTNYPHISTLGLIGFSLNYAIEKKLDSDISFEDIYQNLSLDRDILDFLDKTLPKTFDWSLFKEGSDERKAIQSTFNMIAGGVKNREKRKLGLESSGLHLLLAFTIEALQQQFWKSSE